ncbi:MAG: Transcriptional regulator, AcrR family, partial [uncultured Nocardioides sp.]
DHPPRRRRLHQHDPADARPTGLCRPAPGGDPRRCARGVRRAGLPQGLARRDRGEGGHHPPRDPPPLRVQGPAVRRGAGPAGATGRRGVREQRAPGGTADAAAPDPHRGGQHGPGRTGAVLRGAVRRVRHRGTSRAGVLPPAVRRAPGADLPLARGDLRPVGHPARRRAGRRSVHDHRRDGRTAGPVAAGPRQRGHAGGTRAGDRRAPAALGGPTSRPDRGV